jgi:hypothetical protein
MPRARIIREYRYRRSLDGSFGGQNQNLPLSSPIRRHGCLSNWRTGGTDLALRRTRRQLARTAAYD